ncbi:MAG: clan AA aspartic protease [Gammaproteobacteria bacterium]|nr:clan AA aspartic protease [Gammaproteobacteria bacterium]
MITGVVNANYEATIPLVVQAIYGQEEAIEAIIDTPYCSLSLSFSATGSLTLPPMLIMALGLPWLGRQRAKLGDGSERFFDVYAATILWDGQVRTVETDATDTEPLVGMCLLAGHEVRIRVLDGGNVTIEGLP